jgi:FkbM family methyltransferase
MTAFDVGANVGYFTLLLSMAVGPAGHVFAFEPDPTNFAFLQSHLSLNRCTNVSAIEAAASNRTGEAQFECARSMGHVSPTGRTTVRTIRLDEFPTPDIIKMDIEGGEFDAIPGALCYRLQWISDGHVMAKPA